MTVSIHPIPGLPLVRPGDNLPALLFTALDRAGQSLTDGDILVVCQKVVSKAEGRIIDLRTITASPFAEQLAATMTDKDPRVIEVVLGETKRIVKMESGHLIVETGLGWVCANAGVDESNTGDPNLVVLLPTAPDMSARGIVHAADQHYGCRIAVIITDTFGRPWREGLVDFALGVAGINPLLELRGTADLDGRELRHTVVAHADALAAAAGLVMPKGDGIPAALIRGYDFPPEAGAGTQLLRAKETDLFR